MESLTKQFGFPISTLTGYLRPEGEKCEQMFPIDVIPGDITAIVKTVFRRNTKSLFYTGQITSTRIQHERKELSK